VIISSLILHGGQISVVRGGEGGGGGVVLIILTAGGGRNGVAGVVVGAITM